jgi:hypothetical protein
VISELVPMSDGLKFRGSNWSAGSFLLFLFDFFFFDWLCLSSWSFAEGFLSSFFFFPCSLSAASSSSLA